MIRRRRRSRALQHTDASGSRLAVTPTRCTARRDIGGAGRARCAGARPECSKSMRAPWGAVRSAKSRDCSCGRGDLCRLGACRRCRTSHIGRRVVVAVGPTPNVNVSSARLSSGASSSAWYCAGPLPIGCTTGPFGHCHRQYLGSIVVRRQLVIATVAGKTFGNRANRSGRSRPSGDRA